MDTFPVKERIKLGKAANEQNFIEKVLSTIGTFEKADVHRRDDPNQ